MQLHKSRRIAAYIQARYYRLLRNQFSGSNAMGSELPPGAWRIWNSIWGPWSEVTPPERPIT